MQIVRPESLPSKDSCKYEKISGSYDTILAFGLKSREEQALIFLLDAKNKGTYTIYISPSKDRYIAYANFAVITKIPGVLRAAINRAKDKKVQRCLEAAS